MAVYPDVPFDDLFKAYFDAELGAYSLVTPREGGKDRQVTVTGAEKAIMLSHFGEAELDAFRGNDTLIEAKGLDARRRFRRFPTGEEVFPKLKYPKIDESELRLYFNEAEFTVRPNDYWGVFVRDNDIWICSFSQQTQMLIELGELSDGSRTITLEPDDDNFQELANGAPPAQVTATVTKWARNPLLAAQAFSAKNHTCELIPNGPTFISKKSGRPFNEAHHLIPMKEQARYAEALDTLDNICVLSPFAHRKLHHASFDAIVPDLKSLIASRGALLERHGLLQDDVLGLYR